MRSYTERKVWRIRIAQACANLLSSPQQPASIGTFPRLQLVFAWQSPDFRLICRELAPAPARRRALKKRSEQSVSTEPQARRLPCGRDASGWSALILIYPAEAMNANSKTRC